jgi:hypothetical protein
MLGGSISVHSACSSIKAELNGKRIVMLTPHARCCNFINPAEFSEKLTLLDGGQASLLTGFAITSDLRAFIRSLAARIRSEPISTCMRVFQSDRDWLSLLRCKCPMASAISGSSMSAITSQLDDESELVTLFSIHLLRCSKLWASANVPRGAEFNFKALIG